MSVEKFRIQRLLPQVALTCVVLATSLSAHAQIYRWVDADGNVHFSDKPVESNNNTDAKSEEVELQRGYTPSTLSVEEQQDAEMLRMQRERANRERRKAEAKTSQEKLAARQEKRREQCERDREKLRAVTEVAVSENGDREIFYLTDDDGNALSVSEHKAAVARLREKIARDC